MTESSPPDPVEIFNSASLIATRREVREAVRQMAAAINDFYADRAIILLVVMTGAVIPVTWIASRLKMPLRIDFIHATRYQGGTAGGELEFRVPPRLNLQDQDILIIDDIYDVGLTLQLIEKFCREQGARTVNSAVLVRKLHDRETTGDLPRFLGLEVEDKYVFGCGMDVYEHWRHLDQIYALGGE